MSRLAGGSSRSPRHRGGPSGVAWYCCTHTRRRVSTAGTSRSQGGAAGSEMAPSSQRPSAPMASASAAWAAAARGQAVVGEGVPVALDPAGPVRLQLRPQPVRGHHGQAVQGVAQGLADDPQPGERPHRRQHVRRVRPLAPAGPEEARRLEAVEQRVEQQAFGSPRRSRVRNSLSTEASKPASSSGSASAYFQSMRPWRPSPVPAPPRAIVSRLPLLTPFAAAFTAPTFRHALVLVTGALLASGRRTVAAALRAAGFRPEDVGVALRDRTAQGELVEETGTKAAEGAAAGVLGGGLLGGLVGLLVGVGALALPGLGPVVAGGALASAFGLAGGTAVAGAGIGAAAGGLVGALVGMGIPEEEAQYFERGFRAGGVLVTVHARGRAPEALRLLERHGADTGAGLRSRAATG